MNHYHAIVLVALLWFVATNQVVVVVVALQQPQNYRPPSNDAEKSTIPRRTFLVSTTVSSATAGSFGIFPPLPPSPAQAVELSFSTAASGIQWADAKVGNGPVKKMAENVAIDYVMSTTGARYGSKIYSTADLNAPYRWTLGDGTTIRGLEEAIVGGNGIEPMQPGGIRRVIIPSNLAYESLAKPIEGGLQVENCKEGVGVGPIPPPSTAFEEFQRFKNIYCNANRVYQPDLVMDIKLYGRRSAGAGQ